MTGLAYERPPLPEPIFTETVTNLDGPVGEYQLETKASEWRALRGGAQAFTTSLQGEWILSERFGARIEPAIERGLAADAARAGEAPRMAGGLTSSVCWKLVRDFAREAFLQAEGRVRLPWGTLPAIVPGEPMLPGALSLRGAVRVERLTLHGSVGVLGGGEAVHAPVRGSLGLFLPFAADERAGFFGAELELDAARRAPALVALNVVPNLEPLGVPVEIGLGLPLAIGARESEPSRGVFVRLSWTGVAR